MKANTPTRRPGAIVLACILTLLTAWITLRDASSLSDLTPSHALTLAAIALAIYTGHTAFPLIGARRFVSGLSALAIAVSSTGYVAAVAGIRNTAVVAANAQRIAEDNAARTRADKRLEDALKVVTELEAEEKAECKKVGDQCTKKSARTNAARDSVLVAEQARKRLGAMERPGAGYDGLATLIALLPGVTAPQSVIEQHLIVALPWLVVVIAELGTVLCWSIGLPRHRTVAHSLPNPDTIPPAELDEARRILVPPKNGAAHGSPNRSPNGSDPISAYILTEIALGRAIPSQQGVAERFGVSRSTAHERFVALEAAGLIVRRREGRRMVAVSA